MHLGLYQLLLILAGGLCLAGGVLFLWNIRAEVKRAADGDLADARATPATRYVFAIVLLILGYHGIVWALPERWVEVQFPRSRWFVVILGGIGICLGSILLDRLERTQANKRPDKRQDAH